MGFSWIFHLKSMGLGIAKNSGVPTLPVPSAPSEVTRPSETDHRPCDAAIRARRWCSHVMLVCAHNFLVGGLDFFLFFH